MLVLDKKYRSELVMLILMVRVTRSSLAQYMLMFFLWKLTPADRPDQFQAFLVYGVLHTSCHLR